MSIATARAYQPYFAGRFMPSGSRKSHEIKPFHGWRSTFAGKAHCIKDSVLLDGACGTSGMLTVAQNRLLELAKKHGKEVAIHLFGQEINPETYDKVRRHFIWQRKKLIQLFVPAQRNT